MSRFRVRLARFFVSRRSGALYNVGVREHTFDGGNIVKIILLPLFGLLVFIAGCSTFDSLNPFSDEWIESPNYVPIEYDKAWEIITSNMTYWELETADKEDGEIETLWRQSSQYRVKAQVRLYRVEEGGKEGVWFKLRVPRQRPKAIWSASRTKYDEWVNDDPDTLRQKAMIQRFNYWLLDAIRKQANKDTEKTSNN